MTLDELQAICDAATPGEWAHIQYNSPNPGGDFDVVDEVVSRNRRVVAWDNSENPLTYNDYEFIATARSAMPKLIALVRELRDAAEVVEKTGGLCAVTPLTIDAIIAKHLEVDNGA